MPAHRTILTTLVIAVIGLFPAAVVAAEPADATSVEQNEAVIHQVFDLLNQRKLDEAFELYAVDYKYHGPGGEELRGRDEIRALWAAWFEAFPDLRTTVDDIVSEGDKSAVRWRIEGTHTGEFFGVAPSNAEISVGITEIFRFEGGQLVEAWDQYDGLGLMKQIGAIPAEDESGNE